MNEVQRSAMFDDYVKQGRISDNDLVNSQMVSGAQVMEAANGIAKQAIQQYQLPPGQAQPLTYQQYQVLQQYRPEVASFIAEKAPQLISEQQSGAAKQSQNQDLASFQQIGQTGTDAQSQAQTESLLNQVHSAGDQSRADLLRAYSQRGLGGGSQDILANVAAGTAEQGQARQSALDIASQQEQRKMQALQIASNLAGVIRNQNLGVEQANTTSINDFNSRNTMAKRAYDESVVNAQNQAQQFNIGQNQQVANQNVGLSNQYGLINTQRQEAAQNNYRNAQNQRSALQTQLDYNNLGLKQQTNAANIAMQAMASQNNVNRTFGAAQDKLNTRERDFNAMQGLTFGGGNQIADMQNQAGEASYGRYAGITNAGLGALGPISYAYAHPQGGAGGGTSLGGTGGSQTFTPGAGTYGLGFDDEENPT